MLTWLSVIFSVFFPLAFLTTWHFFGPNWAAAAVGSSGVLRLLVTGFGPLPGIRKIDPFGLLLCLAAVLTWSTHTDITIRLYPFLANIVLLFIFFSSCLRPPTVIEKFARLRHPDLPDRAVSYTRRVTLVWCIFFVLNGAIALYTALFCPLAVWALYNGVIAYILIGALLAGEFLLRHFVIRPTQSMAQSK